MHPRTRIALALVALFGALGVVTAAAQDSEVGNESNELEANRQRQQEVAAQLGLLQASDVELQAELDGLGAQIAAQEQAVAANEARLQVLRREVVALDEAVVEAQGKVEAQHDLAVDRAIAAFIHPRPGKIEVLVGTSDLSEVVIKGTLLQEASTRDRAVLDGFEAAARELQQRRAEAAAAARELAQAEAAAEEELSVLQAARMRQEAVREMLAVRISEFRREADDLAAEEAALQSLIADRLRPPPPPPTTEPPTTAPPTTAPPGPTTTDGTGTTGSTTSTTASSPSTTTPPDPGYGLIWPTPGPVTSPFGMRWGRMHNGIDIGDPTGTPVKAAAGGEAFFVGVMGGYGNVVLIDHFNGLITLYAHLDSFAVREGANVSRGAVLGGVGSTGNSTGPHLHFETRVDGVPHDPMAYLP